MSPRVCLSPRAGCIAMAWLTVRSLTRTRASGCDAGLCGDCAVEAVISNGVGRDYSILQSGWSSCSCTDCRLRACNYSGHSPWDFPSLRRWVHCGNLRRLTDFSVRLTAETCRVRGPLSSGQYTDTETGSSTCGPATKTQPRYSS